MFTPAKTVSYEGLVGWTAAQEMAGRPLITGPVAVTLHMWLDVPASWSRVKRQSALAWTTLPTTKPDMDNVVKAVFDALNGVVWRDDVQVVSLASIKRYAATPCVVVEVREIA